MGASDKNLREQRIINILRNYFYINLLINLIFRIWYHRIRPRNSEFKYPKPPLQPLINFQTRFYRKIREFLLLIQNQLV